MVTNVLSILSKILITSKGESEKFGSFIEVKQLSTVVNNVKILYFEILVTFF